MAKTFSPDPTHLGSGAGTADIQDNEARRYANSAGGYFTGKATGANAGTPGAWTPAGSQPPYALADAAGKTATPATLWTTNQYVVLGNGTNAYWNGTAWAAGKAP